MREFRIPLNTDGRNPLLQLVSGKLLRKKQPLLIAKLGKGGKDLSRRGRSKRKLRSSTLRLLR